jgi:putative ABC transport system substrate-binding protein
VPEAAAEVDEAFRQGLRALGYVEGHNVTVERRYSGGNVELAATLAAELVQIPVEVIVASGGTIRAVKEATRTIPIMMVSFGGDPVAMGFAANLARPGGNITGLTNIAPQLSGKRLELLKEAVAAASRVTLLGGPTLGGLTETEAAAQALGLEVQSLAVRTVGDIESAFDTAVNARADGLLILPGAIPITLSHSARVADLAARHHLPAMYPLRQYVDVGGLMAYAPSLVNMNRREATYVDKLLKGTSAAELPIEQPMVFDFVINLKTAQALGLSIPQHVLLQATEIMQ